MLDMARGTWRKRVTERWFANRGQYGGYLRDTPSGYEVIDHAGNVIAGPNRDPELVIRMAHDVGVDIDTDDGIYD